MLLTLLVHRAVRALHGTGSASVEAAVNWVVDHDNDADLDTPLLVAKVCCAVLCCAVLCCAVLCCAVLCCAVLCCAAVAAH